MTTFSQPVLLAVSQVKDFEKFIRSPLDICILMDIHVNLLPSMMHMAHDAGKKIFLHADLLRGISADEYGCEYICQRLRTDGIISTKARILETARRNRTASILRLFLIDSKSLEKGIVLIESLRPDYVELLPGLAWEIIPELKARLAASGTGEIPLLCGGLIRTPQQIDRCLAAGACAVTLSDLRLAESRIAYPPS
ncbi:MAG: glycerol-3-phosphate responsive antiterminator [Lachnospiraceae bacterium]|jgi:glycerol uptake operon antiterminator|nr:glycerol-3-phosphate responsive antiterminator [Lachnospiraceae bacterium]